MNSFSLGSVEFARRLPGNVTESFRQWPFPGRQREDFPRSGVIDAGMNLIQAVGLVIPSRSEVADREMLIKSDSLHDITFLQLSLPHEAPYWQLSELNTDVLVQLDQSEKPEVTRWRTGQLELVQGIETPLQWLGKRYRQHYPTIRI